MKSPTGMLGIMTFCGRMTVPHHYITFDSQFNGCKMKRASCAKVRLHHGTLIETTTCICGGVSSCTVSTYSTWIEVPFLFGIVSFTFSVRRKIVKGAWSVISHFAGVVQVASLRQTVQLELVVGIKTFMISKPFLLVLQQLSRLCRDTALFFTSTSFVWRVTCRKCRNNIQGVLYFIEQLLPNLQTFWRFFYSSTLSSFQSADESLFWKPGGSPCLDDPV